MTPEQLKTRNEAIRKAWDCPLLRAANNAHLIDPTRPWSRYGSREAYNAYFRAYLPAWRAKRKAAAAGQSGKDGN